MNRSWIAVPIGLVAAIAVLLATSLPTTQAHMLAITVFCIVVWIGNPVPPWFTGLIAIGLIGLEFSPALALTGFQSPATWLIVFGLIVGEATRQSGLARASQAITIKRIVDGAMSPRRTYYQLLVLLSVAGLGFALLLPSALVRILIAAPILAEIGSLFNEREPRLGIFFGPLFATYYGAAGILTANLPNIVITGIVDSVTSVSITWTEWFSALFPVMSVLRVILIIVVIAALYRPSTNADVDSPSIAHDRTGDARKMLGFLLFGVAFWATDSLHGLHPMFGALGVAALALLPRIGVMDSDSIEDIDFSLIFFVGAVFAIAKGLTTTDFTDVAAHRLLTLISGDASTVVVLAAVFFVTLALAFLLEGVAVASVLTPILVSFAASANVPVTDVAFIEATALSTYFFPYQSMVLVVMLREDLVEPWDTIKVAGILSLITIFVLLPLQLGYLSLL